MSNLARMETEDYKATLERFRAELEKAKATHQNLLRFAEAEEQKIAHLRQSVSALAQLCGESFEDDDEFGLTDAIRMALKAHGGALNAQQVKVQIERLGFNTAKYTNALASIHTVLKRLAIKGELDDAATSDGKTAYRWIAKQTITPGELKQRATAYLERESKKD